MSLPDSIRNARYEYDLPKNTQLQNTWMDVVARFDNLKLGEGIVHLYPRIYGATKADASPHVIVVVSVESELWDISLLDEIFAPFNPVLVAVQWDCILFNDCKLAYHAVNSHYQPIVQTGCSIGPISGGAGTFGGYVELQGKVYGCSCCHVVCHDCHKIIKLGSDGGEMLMSNSDFDANLLRQYFDEKLKKTEARQIQLQRQR
jgi:hypothetical protein